MITIPRRKIDGESCNFGINSAIMGPFNLVKATHNASYTMEKFPYTILLFSSFEKYRLTVRPFTMNEDLLCNIRIRNPKKRHQRSGTARRRSRAGSLLNLPTPAKEKSGLIFSPTPLPPPSSAVHLSPTIYSSSSILYRHPKGLRTQWSKSPRKSPRQKKTTECGGLSNTSPHGQLRFAHIRNCYAWYEAELLTEYV